MNTEKTIDPLALRSHRSAFWHYPLAFIFGMVWALIPAFIGLFFLKVPFTFASVVSTSFVITLLCVLVIETFHWRKIFEHRRLAFSALEAAKEWTPGDKPIRINDVKSGLLSGIQNQRMLHTKRGAPEMLEQYKRISAEHTHDREVPDLRFETLAMEPWMHVIFPFYIVFGILQGA